MRPTTYARNLPASNQKMLKEQMKTHPQRRHAIHRFRCAMAWHLRWDPTRCKEISNGKRIQVLIQNHPITGAGVRRGGVQALAEMMLMIAIIMVRTITVGIIVVPGYNILFFRMAGT